MTAREQTRALSAKWPRVLVELRDQEISSLAGRCRSQMYALEARGEFPKRIKQGHATAYLSSEIDRYIAERVAGRGTSAKRVAAS